jgi:hypothetical protein
MEESGQLHTPDVLSPGETLQYPLGRRVGGPQSGSGSCGEDKNLVSARNPIPALQRVATTILV